MSSLRSFRLLAALSIRLAVRGYLASKAALLGAILLLLVLFPISLKLAGQCRVLLTTPQAETTLTWLLVGLFCLFAFAPLAGAAALPPSGDPARLLMYPVTSRVLALALAMGALAEITTLVALPLIVVLLGHVGVFGLPVLVLLLLTALLTGQALLFLGGSLARSRRVREALTLAAPFLLALLLLFAARQPARAAVPSRSAPRQTLIAPPVALSLAPPGLAARTLQSGTPPAFLGLVLWAVAALLGAAKLAEARAGIEQEGSTTPAGPSPFRLLGTSVLGVIAAKELTYYLREPTFRVALSRSSATLVLVGVIALYPTNAPTFLWDSAIGIGGVLFSVFWVLERTCNLWGVESGAGTLLWGFPGARWHWVLGKNLALAPVLALFELIFLGEYGLIVHAPALTLLRYCGIGALWLLNIVALGNLVSVRLPFPLLGKAATQSTGQSFGTGLVYIGVAVAAAYLAALPLALLWTAILWSGSVALAGRLLVRREADVIEALES